MKKIAAIILASVIFKGACWAAATNVLPASSALMINPTNFSILFPTNAAGITSFLATNDIAKQTALSVVSNQMVAASNSFSGYASTGSVVSATNRIGILEGGTQTWYRGATDATWWTNLWSGSSHYDTQWILLTNGMANWNTVYANGIAITNSTNTWNTGCANAGLAKTNAASWTNWAAANTGNLVNVKSMTRYNIYTNDSYEIIVRAHGTGITATVAGTLVTMTIPANTLLLSARLRWPAAAGNTFTLDLGTTDMGNSALSNRWGAVFAAYREDTGAFLPTASCRLDTANHDRLIISGLITTPGVVNHCVLEF